MSNNENFFDCYKFMTITAWKYVLGLRSPESLFAIWQYGNTFLDQDVIKGYNLYVLPNFEHINTVLKSSSSEASKRFE